MTERVWVPGTAVRDKALRAWFDRCSTASRADQIAALLKQRRLNTLTTTEWDRIIELVDEHIAECERDDEIVLRYGPDARERFDKHRQRARARARDALGWSPWIT